jgi:hypothetical protein
MKYEITLEDRVWQGFVFRVKETQSNFFKRLFSRNHGELYATLPERYGYYIQKVNSPIVWLVQESVTGVICYIDVKKKEFEPAPELIRELYKATVEQIEKDLEEK